jgi:hypothetical protein
VPGNGEREFQTVDEDDQQKESGVVAAEKLNKLLASRLLRTWR